MKFDIRRLENLESDYDEKALEEYQDQLVALFRESPEGLALRETYANAGHWAGMLTHFAYSYLGISPSEMTVFETKEVVENLFPRKVTISPETADEIIPDLVAFWNYLKREYQLEQADDILVFLRKIEPGFPEIMNDPSRFGMAKSMMTTGVELGFDMTTQEGINAFMLHYNEHIANTPNEPAGVKAALPPIGQTRAAAPSPKTRNQRKRMRRRRRK